MTQMSSDLRKGFSVYGKCEITFSKQIAVPYQESFHKIERDVSRSNSINLRFLLGAMESTGKMSQDKNTQCFRERSCKHQRRSFCAYP